MKSDYKPTMELNYQVSSTLFLDPRVTMVYFILSHLWIQFDVLFDNRYIGNESPFAIHMSDTFD